MIEIKGNQFKSHSDKHLPDILSLNDATPYTVDAKRLTNACPSLYKKLMVQTSNNNGKFRAMKAFSACYGSQLDYIREKFGQEESLKSLPFYYVWFDENGDSGVILSFEIMKKKFSNVYCPRIQTFDSCLLLGIGMEVDFRRFQPHG